MDPYNIYAPTCGDSMVDIDKNNNNKKKKCRKIPLKWLRYENNPLNSVSGNKFFKNYTPWINNKLKSYGFDENGYIYNPCMGNWDPVYMTTTDVLESIHASSEYNPTTNGVWPNTPDSWKYGSETQDIALLFPQIFKQAPDWKITVVSGDADAAVPFVGTQRWVECLGRKVIKDWADWIYFDGFNNDVGGIVKVYDGLILQTVKGCGHTIPSYCPQQGFLFFQDFINGTFL